MHAQRWPQQALNTLLLPIEMAILPEGHPDDFNIRQFQRCDRQWASGFTTFFTIFDIRID